MKNTLTLEQHLENLEHLERKLSMCLGNSIEARCSQEKQNPPCICPPTAPTHNPECIYYPPSPQEIYKQSL